MNGAQFVTEQRLAYPIDEVFSFFADAENLETLTPPWLRLRITSPTPIVMAVGTRIDYRLRMRGLPMSWRSEITAWEPSVRFVDEQLKGPYRRWVHTHTFTPVDGGTRVEDHVDYAVPGGRLVDRLFVRRELEKIFSYRRNALREIFP